jgi:hypothetical protein
MDITFTKIFDIPDNCNPQPADKHIPDWYKKLESYIGGERKPSGQGQTTGTVKRCMPVFDAVTSGYIITTYVDIFISQKEMFDTATGDGTGKTIPWYEWPSFNPLGFHPIDQAPNHPDRKELLEEAQYPKWINPWAIKTPPGYSVLFVQPFHRESPFTILPGIVDTDTYTAPVNFPFILNDWKFEGIIPAGTPMVQVIPFKRDSWKMSIGNEKDLIEQNKVTTRLRSKFFDSYKSQYRQPKEYK